MHIVGSLGFKMARSFQALPLSLGPKPLKFLALEVLISLNSDPVKTPSLTLWPITSQEVSTKVK